MLSTSQLGVLIPIIALCIPIVAILVKHQREMAEIMHRGANDANSEILRELQAMRAEMAQLRERVNQQAIVVDDLSGLRQNPSPMAPPEVPDDVRSRIGG
jgi:hypothetical protein